MAPPVIGVTDNLARTISSADEVAVAVIQHGGALPVGIDDPHRATPGITNPRIAMMPLSVISDGYPARKIREPCQVSCGIPLGADPSGLIKSVDALGHTRRIDNLAE